MKTERIEEIVKAPGFLNKLKAVGKEGLFLNSNDRAMLATLRTQKLHFWTPNGKIIVALSQKVDKMIHKLFGIALNTIKDKDEIEDMYTIIVDHYWEYTEKDIPNFKEILVTLNFIAILS